MKKILLLIFISMLSAASYSQIKSYPPLKEEDVDFSAITNENYLMYKLSSTKPSTVKKEIDNKHIIRDFDWKNILTDNSQRIYKMATILMDSLKLREPLADENPNYIYYHTKISNSILPAMMHTKVNLPLIARKGGNYTTNKIPNLHNLQFSIIPKLVNSKKEVIRFGNKCEVTTRADFETDEIEFIIALEVAGCKFSDIQSGNIELQLGNFREPERSVIRKSDVGKTIRFHSRWFDVLAFEDGVLHLRYIKRFADTFRGYKYLGNINGEKFSIKCPYTSILYVVYDKYRSKPKLSYSAFEKYDSPKSKVDIDVRDFDYDVAIFNFGYDVDSVNVYLEEKQLPTMLMSAISVRKQDDKYTFIPIVKKIPSLMSTETFDNYVMEVRKYFQDNVKYPEYAQTNLISGTVSFKFKITPEGTIADIDIMSSPDNSLSNEIRRVAARAKFKFELNETISSVMALKFNL